MDAISDYPLEFRVTSKYHDIDEFVTEWNELSSFPSDPPTTDNVITRGFSDDLWESGGNNGRWWRDPLSVPDTDYGGNFWCVKRTYSEYSSLGKDRVHFSSTSDPMSAGDSHMYVKQWPRRAEFNSSSFPHDTGSSVSELNAFGATAIARTVPTKPEADLGTFLGELREGLPKAILIRDSARMRTKVARNAGDEYLNVEFGWKPLVRDVKSFASAVRNSNRILSDYHNKSGVLIKRRYSWPEKTETRHEDAGVSIPVPHLKARNYGSFGLVPLSCTVRRRQKRWFTAAYMYYCPPPDTPERWQSDANKLLGARLTPNVLWNLAPWSWAADWISNTGDIAANLTYLNTDDLVIHHAYIMEETEISHEWIMEVPANYYRSYPEPQLLKQTFKTVNKRRIRATPYGFGLNWDGFTPKQMAIIGALAASRSK